MGSPYIGLFWRLLIPNATVLSVACVILMLQPPNGRVPALVAGLFVMLAVNLLLLRHAINPLVRLTEVMAGVDPLAPGQRVPVTGPPSEVTVLGHTFNDMLDRLEQERSDSGRRALTETEAERRRIAAELHDEIGQSLTAIALHLNRLAEGETPHTADLLEVRDTVLTTVDAVRGLARDLRPEALDTLGLVPALTNLTERLSHQTGIHIERDLDRRLPTLSPEAELVIYRVAQESLTNALRHAGAHRLVVSLRGEDGYVTLTVRDDGQGVRAEAPAGNGIRTMRERALAVGASFELHRPDGAAGTMVRLVLPQKPA